jgi:hypothetical protein
MDDLPAIIEHLQTSKDALVLNSNAKLAYRVIQNDDNRTALLSTGAGDNILSGDLMTGLIQGLVRVLGKVHNDHVPTATTDTRRSSGPFLPTEGMVTGAIFQAWLSDRKHAWRPLWLQLAPLEAREVRAKIEVGVTRGRSRKLVEEVPNRRPGDPHG